ncbi:LysM peptidoglycan-binding domain-containing protein [Halopseudomonas salegens]|uniref:Membrane-bound lytic murein transglycosylase D n=1 Tax=Halopseudomonas salegens TaxID=1434072 RepID=A0A1H2EVV9_9GAMM|nr:LysM peptidoglycan-binding domain-containing protein [Halopseudomonas salegens]SDT99189.1 membrane-bound lytic murein transglycosylase D [Halopseudomonas salegens]
MTTTPHFARARWRLGASLGLMFFLAGCQTTSKLPTEPITPHAERVLPVLPADVKASPEPVAAYELTVPDDSIWARIRSGYQLQEQAQNQARIQQQLHFYARHPRYFEQTAPRAERYLHYVVEQLEERQMPKEFALLPFIESAYNPQANSHAQAAGIWQFIPSTGRHFELHQDWWYDGRRDITASTQAALDYLSQLSERFEGDWLLALAAYNCGGGCVSRAITRNEQQGLPTDYWSLRLPRETMHYVPKLLAMAQVVEQPERFGTPLPDLPDAPYFAAIDLNRQLDLHKAAELAEISPNELRQLNPAYHQRITAPRREYQLLVPVDKAESFSAALEALPDSAWVDYQPYQVRRGDNLSTIAQRHSVSITAIRDINNLRGNLIRAGQTLMLPKPLETAQGNNVPQQASAQSSTSSYTVRSGDSLWTIARQHGISVASLKQTNNLSSNALQIGQQLRLPGSTASNQQQTTYTVRSGDSLYSIARRFKIEIDHIRNWNTLGRHLQPGQQLTLYLP